MQRSKKTKSRKPKLALGDNLSQYSRLGNLAGNTLSSLTAETSEVGQGVGGALQGAATGAALGP